MRDAALSSTAILGACVVAGALAVVLGHAIVAGFRLWWWNRGLKPNEMVVYFPKVRNRR